MDKLELAKWLHDNYEEVAKSKGWDTQKDCKVEFDTLPDANKKTMLEIADRLLNFNLLSKHFVSGQLVCPSDKDIRKMAKKVCNGHQHAMRYNQMLECCFNMGKMILEEKGQTNLR